MTGRGALAGCRIVDLSRLAPGPYATMLLADLGADVILVEPPGGATRGGGEPMWWELERDPELHGHDALRRGKQSVVLDLKDADDRALLGELVRDADVVVEGFRPGVAARLGADYESCRALNPAVVHCSITGYRDDGPDAQTAGHDVNYLARAGVLSAIAAEPDGRPAIPMNVMADFAGGGLFAALAIVAALRHRDRTGEGQSISLALEDGALALMTYAAGLLGARGVEPEPRRFFLSGGLPYYDVYRARDGRWFAVGALEPWFFAALCEGTGRPDLVAAHGDETRHAEIAAHLEAWFNARDADEVTAALAGRDACVTPVLGLAEAVAAARERGATVTVDGIEQIGFPARLSRTPAAPRSAGPRPGQHDAEIRKEAVR